MFKGKDREGRVQSGLPTFTGAQMLFQLYKLCHFMLFSVKLKIMPFYSIFKATISKFSKKISKYL